MQVPIDQNFPEPILDTLSPYVPDIEFLPLLKIDSHLPEASDRELLIALHQLQFNWLVTLNYKMLRNPAELAAVINTKINVFAIEGLGHDPIRATGALLLHLPPAMKVTTNSGQTGVFWIRSSQPKQHDAWELFTDAAERRNIDPDSLYSEVKISNAELITSQHDSPH